MGKDSREFVAQDVPRNAVYILQGETSAVVSSMRKNTRWSSLQRSVEYQDPLLQGFGRLKDALLSVHDVEEYCSLDPYILLEPFLEVIKADNTTGWITGAALMSVEKFLSFGLFNIKHPNAPECARKIAEAVIKTHFEATDVVSDEVVLMKILEVLKTLLRHPAGVFLTDELVCEMLQSCFGIAFQMRLSEVLRRQAEHILGDMIRLLFHNLGRYEDIVEDTRTSLNIDAADAVVEVHALQVASEGNDVVNAESEATEEGELGNAGGANVESNNTSGEGNGMTVCEGQTNLGNSSALDAKHQQLGNGTQLEESDKGASPPVVNGEGRENGAERENVEEEVEKGPAVPYGMPCVREVLRFLTVLINPTDHRNSDSKIRMGLSLLTVAFESCGSEVRNFPSLYPMISDKICRNLFKVARFPSLPLFTMSLRVCFLIFESMRNRLKFQLEVFLNYLMARIHEEHHMTTFDHQIVALETIVQFCHIPSFVVELFLNYDCDVNCSNMFDNLMKFLSKNSFPTTGMLYTTHLLALDALLAVIDNIEQRCQGSKRLSAIGKNSQVVKNGKVFVRSYSKSAPKYLELPGAEDLQKIRARKVVLLSGIEEFNKKPKKGIEFLQSHQFLKTPIDPLELARFLQESPLIDKAQLGDYLGAQKNLEVLKAFVSLFEFSGKRIDEALRSMLETFRLPGESQVIDRIMEVFSTQYVKFAKDVEADKDSLYVLSFSIIMLNVDQHNPGVKKSMKCEDFIRNNRGINNGKNFPEEYLTAIFNAIKENEIVMPAEREGELAENYKWGEMLKRADSETGVYMDIPTSVYDKDLFVLIWGPSIAAISYVFETAHDEHVTQKAIDSFKKCAIISGHFNLNEVFDNLIISLCKFAMCETTESHEYIGVFFGRSVKAQVALENVFLLTNKYGNILREGWKNVLELYAQLYVGELLPEKLLEIDDCVAENGKAYLKRKAKKEEVQSSSGLWSLASYLLSSDTDEKTLSLEDAQSKEDGKAFVQSRCQLDLAVDSKYLKSDSLGVLIKAVLNSAKAMREQYVHNKQQISYGDLPQNEEDEMWEDPSVLLLELAINIGIQNRDRIAYAWQPISDFLVNIVENSSEWSFFTERVVVGLITLSSRLIGKPEVHNDVLKKLGCLTKLNSEVDARMKLQIMCGASGLVKANINHLKDRNGLTAVLNIINGCVAHEQARVVAFETLAYIVNEGNNASTFHFEACLDCISKFSSNVEADGNVFVSGSRSSRSPAESPGQSPRSRPLSFHAPQNTKNQPLIIQLMALAYNLHCKVPLLGVGEASKWQYWIRVLKLLSLMCSDPRPPVRQHAITYLQRALLIPELHKLTCEEWRSCFEEVLFPMLGRLLDSELYKSQYGRLDESRMRASALMSKVFLQHMQVLLNDKGFAALWLKLLGFMDKFLHADNSDLLAEAVPESLKNMLLVMHTAGVITDSKEPRGTPESRELWQLTWSNVEKFLPSLRTDLFPESQSDALPAASNSVVNEQAQVVPVDFGDSVVENVTVPAAESPVPVPGPQDSLSPQTGVEQKNEASSSPVLHL
eukprot:Nk52_evm4s2356 gene=Nk52_evmTU4s2356